MSPEQIFKIIFSVTTVRRAIAGLMVVCGIALSLHSIEPKLRTFIPNSTEASSVLSFLGGSFAGYLFYSALLKVYPFVIDCRKKKEENRQEIICKTIEQEQIARKVQDSLSRFKSTYTHLRKSEKETIRLLTLKDGHPLQTDNHTLKQLIRNH